MNLRMNQWIGDFIEKHKLDFKGPNNFDWKAFTDDFEQIKLASITTRQTWKHWLIAGSNKNALTHQYNIFECDALVFLHGSQQWKTLLQYFSTSLSITLSSWTSQNTMHCRAAGVSSWCQFAQQARNFNQAAPEAIEGHPGNMAEAHWRYNGKIIHWAFAMDFRINGHQSIGRYLPAAVTIAS